MKKKIIYFVNAFYCIVALALIAGSIVLHRWFEAWLLFCLFFFIALADWRWYKFKEIRMESRYLKDKNKERASYELFLLDKLTKTAKRKFLIYKCDHCPRKSDTCQKLVYDTHTECVEPVEKFDL